MADRDSINKTIDAYLVAFTARDRAEWLACFSEDAWIEDPVGSARRQGREAIGAFWDETHRIPDAIELRPLGIRVVIGDEAAFTMEARPNLGGATYALDIIDHMTFDDDGKIASLRAFFDSTSMHEAD